MNGNCFRDSSSNKHQYWYLYCLLTQCSFRRLPICSWKMFEPWKGPFKPWKGALSVTSGNWGLSRASDYRHLRLKVLGLVVCCPCMMSWCLRWGRSVILVLQLLLLWLWCWLLGSGICWSQYAWWGCCCGGCCGSCCFWLTCACWYLELNEVVSCRHCISNWLQSPSRCSEKWM